MDPPTLVLSRRHSPDSQALWRAANEAGWDVVRVHGYDAPAELFGRKHVAFYCETLLADAVAPALGVVLFEPDARWLAELPAHYLRRALRAATLAEVRDVRTRAFVKPADEKVFAARVYDAGEPIDAARLLEDATAVFVSEPVRFEVELRAFIADRSVRAISAYVRDGDIAQAPDGSWPLDPAELEGAKDLLRALLADPGVSFPPALVVDVGRIEGRGWAVVEANAAWASGVCGCDPRAVLDVVRRACVRAEDVEPGDERWGRRIG